MLRFRFPGNPDFGKKTVPRVDFYLQLSYIRAGGALGSWGATFPLEKKHRWTLPIQADC